jgi:type III pantothenate kinase
MLLTIDVGNTNITLGLYAGQERNHAWRLATVHNRMPDEYGLQMLGLLEHARCEVGQIEGCALASVVPPLTGTFLQACRHYLNQEPLVIDAGVKTGLSIRYEDPKHALGADRVADAVAVRSLYGTPACVVDFGTATTFDAISEAGEYLGGAIAPGIDIAAEALFLRAAKLPRVELARPESAIGRNTLTAIQSGLVFGYVGLVEGMVARFKRELGEDAKVVGTGGLVDLIAPETRAIEFVAPWLTLDGLRIIWDLNRGT